MEESSEGGQIGGGGSVLPDGLPQRTGAGVSGARQLHKGSPGLIASLRQVEPLSMSVWPYLCGPESQGLYTFTNRAKGH